MKNVKIVSVTTINKYETFEIKKHTLELESGKKIIHYNAARKPVSVVFPLTNSYELYLVSQYRYFLGKITLEAVAGFIEPGETAIKAAKRELKEETGIVAAQLEELSRIETTASVFRATHHLFLAKELEMKEPDPDEDEKLEVVKLSLSEAVDKIITGEIYTASTIVGILILDKLRKEKKL